MRLGYFDTEYAKASSIPAAALPDATVCPSPLAPYPSPAKPYQLTVHMISDPQCVGANASITSLPSGMSCTLAGGEQWCTVGFDNQTITLTQSSSVTRFEGWSGDCTGTGASCPLTFDTDKYVTARFCGLIQ